MNKKQKFIYAYSAGYAEPVFQAALAWLLLQSKRDINNTRFIVDWIGLSKTTKGIN